MADAAGAPAGSRRLSTLLMLCCASLLATGLPLPFGLAALVFAVPTVVVAIRVLAAKGRQPRVFAALAIALAVMLGGVAGLRALFYTAQYEYEQCVDGAITQEGRTACDLELRRSIYETAGMDPNLAE